MHILKPITMIVIPRGTVRMKGIFPVTNILILVTMEPVLGLFLNQLHMIPAPTMTLHYAILTPGTAPFTMTGLNLFQALMSNGSPIQQSNTVSQNSGFSQGVDNPNPSIAECPSICCSWECENSIDPGVTCNSAMRTCSNGASPRVCTARVQVSQSCLNLGCHPLVCGSRTCDNSNNHVCPHML